MSYLVELIYVISICIGTYLGKLNFFQTMLLLIGLLIVENIYKIVEVLKNEEVKKID